MAIDHQHFFTRCPHCRTMFRVGNVVTEENESWVKCGRCKKVFDYKKNKIDPTAFLKPIEISDATSPETEAGDQTETTNPSTLSVHEKTDSTDHETKPEDSITNARPGNPTETTKLSTPAAVEKTDFSDHKTKSEHLTEKIESSLPSAEKESINTGGDNQPEQQLSFIKAHKDEKVENIPPQKPLFISKTDSVEKNETPKQGVEVKKTAEREKPIADQQSITTQDPKLRQPRVPVPHLKAASSIQASQQPTTNIKTDKKTLSKASELTKNIMAHAQSLKKDKNRSDSKTNYSAWLIIIGLLALLIWQTAIVNYTKLKNYSFLSTPLNLVCSVFSCNQQQPLTQSEFEILHANLRRHGAYPGVITISANLINYSNGDRLLPKIRLDLTDANASIVASKTINLIENPQLMDPAVSQLAPGQDVKIALHVDRPPRSAVGFELNIVN